MSGTRHEPAPDAPHGPADPSQDPLQGAALWATLTPAATRDEIAANRRSERFVTFAGAAGLVLTLLVLLVVAVTR